MFFSIRHTRSKTYLGLWTNLESLSATDTNPNPQQPYRGLERRSTRWTESGSSPHFDIAFRNEGPDAHNADVNPAFLTTGAKRLKASQELT